tara:strand:- start:231 stop:809 length:579 start_codon:yes stop_codon:yes gene_type:complete
MAKGKFFSGDYRLVIVKVVAIGVIIFVLYKLATQLFRKKTPEETQADQIDQNNQEFLNGLNDAQPPAENTGSVPMPSISIAEAGNIANIQYNAMQGGGTDEMALFSSLCGLNGADLILVAQEFGIRDDKTIFQYYYYELCSSINYLTGCLGYGDDENFTCGVPQCQVGLFGVGGCSELEMMKGIWVKSGLQF